MSLYQELKRRNVFRVAIAYLALAWLLIEVAGTVFPGFGIPDWVFRFVVIALTLGFLPTLVISWAYEITPEGLKREKEVVRESSITHQTAKRLDMITIVIVLAALVFIIVDRLWLNPQLQYPQVPEMESAHEPPPAGEPVSFTQFDSIAVLPFANRSANPDDAFFVDGIHDDLLTHVSQISAVKVISRTSVMKYRNSTLSIPEIAEELQVSTVLEGGVQRAGEQVRINVQLIDARTDSHLWSNIYDRQLTASNIFAIQSEIARAIAEALRINLSPEAQSRIADIPTNDLDALEAYFIGRQSMGTRTVADLEKAIMNFEKAVILDPEFALAWVGKADTYLLQAAYAGLPRDEMLAKSLAAAEQALRIDPNLGEAYASLAKQRDWAGDEESAEAAFKKALALNPNYAPSFQWYGEMLRQMDGRITEALQLSRMAVELDPKSAIIMNDYAEVLESADRHEEALSHYEQAIEIEPKFATGYVKVGVLKALLHGRFDEAMLEFNKALEIDPESVHAIARVSWAYLSLGDPSQAETWRNRLYTLAAENNWYSISSNAELHIYRGEFAQAMEYVHKRLSQQPRDEWALTFLGHYELRNGNATEMLSRYERSLPELLGDDPGINKFNVVQAVELALLLQETGEVTKARGLLDRSLAVLPDKTWLSNSRSAPLDARIYALLGDKEKAIQALRHATDQGWRVLWWYFLEQDPALQSLHGQFGYQALKEEIEQDMALQHARVRKWEAEGSISSWSEN